MKSYRGAPNIMSRYWRQSQQLQRAAADRARLCECGHTAGDHWQTHCAKCECKAFRAALKGE